MSISSLNSETISMCSQTWENSKRFSTVIPRIANNLTKIAIPVIVMMGLTNFPGAFAGPLEYAGCVMACTLFATPVAFPGCVTACLPLLFLPTP